MKKKQTFNLVAIALLTFLLSCQTNQALEPLRGKDEISAINWNQIEFSVPQNVTEELDSLVLIQAKNYECDGIRILATNLDSFSFLISYFTDDEGIKAEELYSADIGFNQLNQSQSTILASKIGDYTLRKKNPVDNEACYFCWPLAQFWVDANYSGTCFQFSQEATSTGYYHKIIYNLSSSAPCCADNFSGGLNNIISSHRWDNEVICHLRTSVHQIKVWEEPNISGPSYTFTSSKAHYDNNYIDEDFCDWVLYTTPPMYICYTLNDKVSSIDMMYYVVNN